MNIIIIGCGKVGQELTEHLNEASNNITVVDTQQTKLNYIAARCDVLTVCGNGATHAVQQEAKIDTADLLIAVTGSDELNLLCCLIAKKAGNCHTIARVRSPQYLGEAPYLKDELGLAMVINPEFESAAEIARVLRFPSAMKIETFAKGRVELLKFKLPEGSPLVGMAVKEISSKLHCDVLICTIERNISPVIGSDGEISEEAYIAYGDFVFEEKDVISIVATPRNANTFFKRINYKLNSAKDVMIVGGGSIAVYLCAILVKSGINVTLIDKDPQRCEELESMLDDVRIICGDGSDQETLLEEGLAEADGFVALTNLDEENILLSLYAKSRSKAKLCTKVNRIDFTDVIKKLDLDTLIYPKNITAEGIVRYVRAMKNSIGSNMETLYSIIKGKIEAAEFTIKENSPITDVPLMELKLKQGVLIAAILRDRKVIIPRGSDTIQAGDSVVVVTTHLELNDINDLLLKR